MLVYGGDVSYIFVSRLSMKARVICESLTADVDAQGSDQMAVW